jgi:outer membrane protein assembly factor BamB
MRRIQPRTLACLTLVAGLALLLKNSLEAEEKQGQTKGRPESQWLVFRGNPQQTGVAASTLPDKLKVRWQFKAKDGVESTAAIADGTAYIGSFDQHLYALDLKSGRQKWSYKAGPFKAPVAVHAGSIYAGDEDGGFHCLDAANGTKRWTFDAGAEVTSGAAFAGDDVLFGAGNGTLYCLTQKDGKKKWDFAIPGGPVNATPAVSGGHTFVAGCDSTLHVINTTTGKEKLALQLAGQVGATGAVVGEKLYIGTMTNDVQAIDWAEGKLLWTARKRRQPFYASVAVSGELVLAGCKDKRLYALDRKTGNDVWSFLTGGRIESSPVVTGKRVYLGSLDKNLYVLDLAKGSLIQKVELDSEVVGSPAVADGCLVLGTAKGTVYCLE